MDDIADRLKAIAPQQRSVKGEKNARLQAASIAAQVFDVPPWGDAAREFFRGPFSLLMLSGALDELALHQLSGALQNNSQLLRRRSYLCWGPFPWSTSEPITLVGIKQTSASDFLQSHGLDAPPGIATELPSWLRDKLQDNVRALMLHEFWDNIAMTTRKDLERVLIDGVTRGRTISELSQAVQSVAPEYSRFRARMLARTESTGALNSGHQAVLEQLAQETQGAFNAREWVAVLDERTRPTHDAADGQTREISKPFDVGGFPAMYPGDPALPVQERVNCLPPGQLIEGELTAATRAWYHGPVAEIVFRSGRRITLTPNHPVVTPNGLIAACHLQRGDQVWASKVPIDSTAGVRPGGNHENHKPLLCEQVFEAFLALGSTSGRVEIMSAEEDDFDGDAQWFDSQIEIVRTDGKLLHAREPRRQDDVLGNFLAREHVRSTLLSRLSTQRLFLRAMNPATHRGMRLGGQLQPFSLGQSSHPQSIRFGAAANWNVSLAEPANQKRAVVATFNRKLKQRFAGDVILDEIVEIRNLNFAGHVYDFESGMDREASMPKGWFLCNGIFVRNCRCTLISSVIVDGELSGDRPQPVVLEPAPDIGVQLNTNLPDAQIHRPDSSWKEVASLKAIKDQAKEKLSIGTVKTVGFKGENKKKIEDTNQALRIVANIHDRFPHVKKLAAEAAQKLKTFTVFNSRDVSVKRAAGLLNLSTSELQTQNQTWLHPDDTQFAGIHIGRSNFRLGFGVFAVDDSAQSTVRHEYGHFIDTTLGITLRPGGRVTSGKLNDRWRRAIKTAGPVDTWLSKYGASDDAETFAESFTAITHHNYGRPGVPRLPKSIEQFMVDFVFNGQVPFTPQR